ncbi:hypothetical protein GTP44_01050 [Duganella sp. FT50W]|uniref:Phage virion morphogenesis protein n=1 Tax=Duganella lactea TaxID=2692173 RepID=A0A6L8MCU6_9BURK|nr:phage virion morphogenesis protein [Duganella lactea]MYM80547.1 hypothetical protein [Duganella lactea]
MSMITVSNQAFNDALTHLAARLDDMQPVLQGIGEDQVDRIKQRFATATAPDGAKWKPNSQATLVNYIASRGGFSKKTGKVSAKGRTLAISKRPLQGASGDLARQIFYVASASELVVGSSMIYAAMQHYGGTKAQFPHLWGDIPARPFLPVTPAGELYPQDVEFIVTSLRDYLVGD